MSAPAPSKTTGRDDVDWAVVDATTDADIARQIAEDPDTAPDIGSLDGPGIVRTRDKASGGAIS